MTLQLVLSGASGRMGQAIFWRAKAEDIKVLGGLYRASALENLPDLQKINGIKNTPAAAQCIIDFSVPEMTHEILTNLPKHVSTLVIGTTGLSAETTVLMEELAKTRRIVYARNFSIGITALAMVAEHVSAALGTDWDAEVHETHHKHKIDAPSGTAYLLAEAVESGHSRAIRPAPYLTESGARQAGEIGMSVSRMGGVFGMHSVNFASEAETITLSHTAHNRDVFAAGALHAAKWAVTQPAGLYSMTDVLGLR